MRRQPPDGDPPVLASRREPPAAVTKPTWRRPSGFPRHELVSITEIASGGALVESVAETQMAERPLRPDRAAPTVEVGTEMRENARTGVSRGRGAIMLRSHTPCSEGGDLTVRDNLRRRLVLIAGITGVTVLGLVAAFPAAAVPGYNTSSDPYVALTGAGQVKALINSGETAFGTLFEGIPDGIGVVPGPGKNNEQGYVDLYVAHEQSHVPFGGFADFQDSSVSRVRVDIASKSIIDTEVVLSPDLGYNRFCSAFMAGPEHGFPHYTFMLNEESSDVIRIPDGAPYGPDPSVAPYRQSGLAVYLDTTTGKSAPLASQGRHNHENTVIVPGWKRGIVALSGDDTFTFPSTPARPNLSQLYLSMSHNWQHFQKDESALYAFRVTGNGGAAIDPSNAFNGANDYLDIEPGDNWTGEFIRVPEDVARGTTSDSPQDALEDWSNANNVFQFVRVEDIAYDPDNPRTVYFADTGNSRLIHPTPDTGRLYRASSSTPGTASSNGRIFRMEMNAGDPTKVDQFSILAQADDSTAASTYVAFKSPDNIDVGKNSLMVQEDTSNAKIWQYALAAGTWTHVATATQPSAETSGIVDVSRWFGAGWWALDVQSHVNLPGATGPHVWENQPGGPSPQPQNYTKRREDGQLLLMQVPGS